MEIDYKLKKVKLAARELASFQLESSSEDSKSFTLERARLGQKIHNERADSLRKDYGERLKLEVPFKENMTRNGWVFSLQGRVDQILSVEGRTVVREIKSVTLPLHFETPETLRDYYPEYFIQSAIYARIFQADAEIEFVSINDGSIVTIKIDDSDFQLLEDQFLALENFLITRENSRREIISSENELSPMFPLIRDEQSFAREALHQAFALRKNPVFFEAPTGFGKTGISLHLAMEQLHKGHIDRIIFLSGKSTGQWEAIDYLQTYQNTLPVNICNLRNREEHAIHSPLFISGETILSKEEVRRRIHAAGLTAKNLFRNSFFDVERARQFGEVIGVEPFWLSKYALCFSDVWIADYNYIFSPAAASVFENVPDFRPKRTLLIIDEAHNLPERVRGLFHVSINASKLGSLFDALRWISHDSRLLAVFQELLQFIEELRPSETLDDNIRDHLNLLFSRVRERLVGIFLQETFLENSAREALSNFYQSLSLLKTKGIELLFSCPEASCLNIYCLDASQYIADVLHPFKRTCFMSATLQPIDDFKEDCGLKESDNALIVAESEWQKSTIRLAIDERVDTRFSQRENSFAITAKTLIDVVAANISPVVVFFPSYSYAETIVRYLHATAPHLSIASQPRHISLEGQEDFIRQSLISAHLLFLVLGSSFSESINALGGNVDTALIVSPGIPEPDKLNKAKEKYLKENGISDTFRKIYLIPAMRRIKQAIGRLARSPEHQVKIILHCCRFRQNEYQTLLGINRRDVKNIRTQNDLESFLSE